jgi:hypothetical protein
MCYLRVSDMFGSSHACPPDRTTPEAHFALKYNVMPWVGALSYGEAARTSEPVPFPASKPLVT